MKIIWNALALLAIAHVLAILGLVGWLAATQRISRERLDTVRAVLREPVPVELARVEAEQAKTEQTQGEKAAAQLPDPPLSAVEQIEDATMLNAAGDLRLDRLRRETEDLARTLDIERRRIEEDRAALESERTAFDAMRVELKRVEGDAQFKKALGVLKELKPADARAMLEQVINGAAGAVLGDPAPGIDRAVAYLNAMGSSESAAIIAQFAKDSPDVAADLLERIRVQGLVTASAPGATTP